MWAYYTSIRRVAFTVFLLLSEFVLLLDLVLLKGHVLLVKVWHWLYNLNAILDHFLKDSGLLLDLFYKLLQELCFLKLLHRTQPVLELVKKLIR